MLLAAASNGAEAAGELLTQSGSHTQHVLPGGRVSGTEAGALRDSTEFSIHVKEQHHHNLQQFGNRYSSEGGNGGTGAGSARGVVGAGVAAGAGTALLPPLQSSL